jgi:heptosyltransferase-2
VFYYLDLLRELGVPTVTPDNRLHLTSPMKGKARELLVKNGWNEEEPLVGIHPGATNSSAKRWFPARYSEVGERLADLVQGRVVLLGGPSERALTLEILESMKAAPLDLSGKTSLEELMGILGALSIFVTNDSGPMHVAAALGTPTVAVFGPTDERETGPMGQASKVVRKEVDCSPCLFKECPTDHRCMHTVDVEDVVQSASELLGKKEKPGAREAVS